jgi:hypothetical protein
MGNDGTCGFWDPQPCWFVMTDLPYNALLHRQKMIGRLELTADQALTGLIAALKNGGGKVRISQIYHGLTPRHRTMILSSLKACRPASIVLNLPRPTTGSNRDAGPISGTHSSIG